jgi:3-hydroxyacyl-[acyl-carrier-protein] dehydratase
MNKIIDAVKNHALKTVQNDWPSEIIGKFSFENDFIGFSGHFPGYPILPAVIQLLIAQVLIEKQKGCRIRVTKIVKAKFLSEIRPDDLITVQCADTTTDEIQRNKVTISCGERAVSSFNMSYVLEENTKC